MTRSVSALLFISALMATTCTKESDGCPTGHQLMLNRQNVRTPRACVFLDGDCQFIAGILQKEEPLVAWYCR